jgi:hypothetical protein
MTSAPARVLSNVPLPAPPGIAIRAFSDYPAPGTDPHAPHPEFARRSLKDILPLIPAAERPDALLIASPEYLPIPPDLASFPGTKILLITDWNVCLRFLPDLCRLFDFCFTDWPGYRLLRRAGIGNVFHQPLFGHDPAVFRDLGLGRNLDVSFCGNLNAGLHGERNRLLARLARWAGPRPVHLRQAFDRGYVEVLGRSRLVFNWSIRGEANMRLFEAMACGAAPLVEASNQEVPILFQEGKHFFRYDPARLEARLDELLSDPDRIAAVAASARSEVARHTKAAQIGALLETAGRESPRNVGATLAGPSPAGAAREGSGGAAALAKLRLLGSSYTLAEAVAEIQSLSPALPGFDAETLPATLLTLLESASEPLPAVEAFLARLLSDGRQPAPVAAFLRLRAEARLGRWEAVLARAEECLRDLDAMRAPADETGEERLARLRGLYARYYPPIHLGKGFNTDINNAYREDLGGSGWAGLARLLAAHCREAQARAYLALGRPGEALALGAAIPDGTYASLELRDLKARAAEATGDHRRARREWQAAFAESPLDSKVWDKLAEAWMREGDRPGVIAFLEDILILARAFLSADQAERVRARLEQERMG